MAKNCEIILDVKRRKFKYPQSNHIMRNKMYNTDRLILTRSGKIPKKLKTLQITDV